MNRGKKCITKEEFVIKANDIHNFKYSYNNVNIINSTTKINIICPKHGEFKQEIYGHLHGKGCYECSGKKKINLENFINRSNILHNNKYNYSLIENINNIKNVVKIICPKHGEFKQMCRTHLRGSGCLRCGNSRPQLNLEKFIIKSNLIHNNKYDYSLVKEYKYNIKVKIICPKHGIFEQQCSTHLVGHGCQICGLNIKKEKTDFLNYKKIVRRYTRKNKKELYKNWNGYDYYDNNYIKDNLNLHYNNLDSLNIDHKISIKYGFDNGILPSIIGNIDNLCLTKRINNLKKGTKQLC
jgi:hypothetical protein